MISAQPQFVTKKGGGGSGKGKKGPTSGRRQSGWCRIRRGNKKNEEVKRGRVLEQREVSFYISEV